jgi:SAM-dependent methyltransferase
MSAADGDSASAPPRYCPACASSYSRAYGSKRGHTLLECADCKTIYCAHVDLAELAAFYDAYYNRDNLNIPDFVQLRLGEIIATFAPYKSNGRLLDVGCGGGFLALTAKQLGWDAWGTEVSASSVEHLRKQGLNIAHGELADAKFPDGHFDVIVATEVLEHVPDPRALTAECSRVLRPGGLFYATTPHGRGISARMMGARWSLVAPPEHLQLLSTAGMRHLLRDCELSPLRITEEAVNPFELWAYLKRGFTGHRAPVPNAPVPSADHSNYAVNEALLRSPFRRTLKDAANAVLNLTGLGDSLKVWATKS